MSRNSVYKSLFNVLRKVLTVRTHFTSCDDSQLLFSHVLPLNYTTYADLFYDNPVCYCYGSDFLWKWEDPGRGREKAWYSSTVARKWCNLSKWTAGLSAKKKSNELLRLHKMASERTFLLELKTKYAGHYTYINNQLDVIEVVFH